MVVALGEMSRTDHNTFIVGIPDLAHIDASTVLRHRFDKGRVKKPMGVQIDAKKLAGFDQPIEMMVDCHRRVEHFLDVMIQVEELYRGRALDEPARDALSACRSYFSDAAPNHTADEEVSLFPRMKKVLPLDHPVQAAIERLMADHKVAERLHTRIDQCFDHWQSCNGSLPTEQAERLRDDLHAICQHYAEHIRLEEAQVFPVAGGKLAPQQLKDIGKEMQVRRQS